MAWTLCLCIGLCSGFVAGLFGVGGGTVTVPALMLGARLLGIGTEDAAQVAMATSLAIVIPTSISSARAHAARGSIDWRMFRHVAPGVATGALAGTVAACTLGGRWPLAVFIGFALLAARRLAARPPTACPPDRICARPRIATLCRHGLVIGLLSSLAGVGGGLLAVPLLAHYLPLTRAIGTAALLGLPLAAAGLAGYLLAGHPAHCAAGCVGYIFVPAALAVSAAAVATAPLGACLAHRLPVAALKRGFAVLLVLVSADLCAELVR